MKGCAMNDGIDKIESIIIIISCDVDADADDVYSNEKRFVVRHSHMFVCVVVLVWEWVLLTLNGITVACIYVCFVVRFQWEIVPSLLFMWFPKNVNKIS